MKLLQLYIKNFRGIREATIENIGDALVFIGKNNAGKSAILTAIRVLYNDYSVAGKDFYKSSDEIVVKGTFFCEDSYLENYFLDPKIGVLKVPSNTNEYDEAKLGTEWESKKFSEYKTEREDAYKKGQIGDVGTEERFMPIWLKAIKNKLKIANECLELSVTYKKVDCKSLIDNKDAISLLPAVAFIDDTRNFYEEESGKSNTITSNIFNHILKNKIFAEMDGPSCGNCSNRDCEETCINEIITKKVSELTCEDLEKLVNYRTKTSSNEITQHITEQFSKNYRDDFRINIKATSNINKSFSLSTKIYDPALDAEVELSNVGAGVRSIYILSLLQVYQTMNKNNTIFIIEEPELYLHPQLQKSMAKTISDISVNNQVFFTTHSPLMLREFKSSDIRQVRLNEIDYFTEIETTKIDDILNEIGYTTQDIINTDFVVFVEGTSDKEVLELLIERFYNIDIERISVISTNSCNNISFYVTLAFLSKTRLKTDFVIIHDSDTREEHDVKESFKDRIKKNVTDGQFDGIESKIFATGYSSIEGFLFSPELLVRYNVFDSVYDVYAELEKKLKTLKNAQIANFKKHNADVDRCSRFETEYDDKVSNITENLNWMKVNIRGHNYFAWSRSKNIPISTYVNELPESVFEPILNFLDKHDYFKNNRK